MSSPPELPEPSWRKPAGIFLLIGWMAAYAIGVTSFAEQLSALPQLVQIPAYLVLGIAWVAPLRPLFLWMNTGRWR